MLEDSGDVNVRTEAVGKVTLALLKDGVIKGWRNELLPVVETFDSPPVILMERAAYPLFGMKGYGVHVNGFVRFDSGEIKLWVAKRSRQKSTWPGLFDHIVAGGQPHGISPSENVIKECGEEAGIPAELASAAIPVSAVSYTGLDECGNLKRDCLFCYDLALPPDFIPLPIDGEVEEFELQSLDWVVDQVAFGGQYKPNCNLVIIDFLLRHGIISAESPRYLELIKSLRMGDLS
jgi:isopentenyldiphosphate isomerase